MASQSIKRSRDRDPHPGRAPAGPRAGPRPAAGARRGGRLSSECEAPAAPVRDRRARRGDRRAQRHGRRAALRPGAARRGGRVPRGRARPSAPGRSGSWSARATGSRSSSRTSPGRCPPTACCPGSSPSCPTSRPELHDHQRHGLAPGEHARRAREDGRAGGGADLPHRQPHRPRPEDARSPAGRSRDGRPVHITREYVEADKRIVLGFIEPHFMAGFSGGYKGIFPAMADIDAITHYHRAAVIADPKSTWGVLEGNPTQEQIRDNGALLPLDFCINVTLNKERADHGLLLRRRARGPPAGLRLRQGDRHGRLRQAVPHRRHDQRRLSARPEPLPDGEGDVGGARRSSRTAATSSRPPAATTASPPTGTSRSCSSSTGRRRRSSTPSSRPASRCSTSGRPRCWP